MEKKSEAKREAKERFLKKIGTSLFSSKKSSHILLYIIFDLSLDISTPEQHRCVAGSFVVVVVVQEKALLFYLSRHAAASGSSFSRDHHHHPEPRASSSGESISPSEWRRRFCRVLVWRDDESSSPTPPPPTVSVSAAQIQLVGRFRRRGRREEKASWTNRFWVRSEDARGFWVERRVQTFQEKLGWDREPIRGDFLPFICVFVLSMVEGDEKIRTV